MQTDRLLRGGYDGGESEDEPAVPAGADCPGGGGAVGEDARPGTGGGEDAC